MPEHPDRFRAGQATTGDRARDLQDLRHRSGRERSVSPTDATRLAQLQLGANGFAFDPRSGQSFTLNHTGLEALKCLARGYSAEETGRHLAARYPVSAASAAEATSAFLRQLGRYLA